MNTVNTPATPENQLVELKLQVPADLFRAFQRCVWIQIHETGQSQLQVMEEVVRTFLMKHGC